MIGLVANAMLPGVKLRLDAVSHPYTVDGLEVHGNVDGPNVDGHWVEILECGLAHPQLLEQ